VIQGMQATKTSGAAVSFDLNFREKLWKRSGGEERAREVIGRILSQVMFWSATKRTSKEVLDFADRR